MDGYRPMALDRLSVGGQLPNNIPRPQALVPPAHPVRGIALPAAMLPAFTSGMPIRSAGIINPARRLCTENSPASTPVRASTRLTSLAIVAGSIGGQAATGVGHRVAATVEPAEQGLAIPPRAAPRPG